MEMPKPSPGHKDLERLSGNWEGPETMHPSQWDPKGGTAVGRSKNRIDLSGFALISDYEQERDGKITFTGHGVMTFDPQTEDYVFHWFDCMGSPPEVFRGRFDGNVLTMSHGAQGGEWGMHARYTYDFKTPDRMETKMEMSKDGSNWQTLFEGTYKKI